MVAQTKRQKVLKSFAYVEDKIHEANRKLRIEDEDSPDYDAGFKSGLDTSAKQDLGSAIKMIRWLASDLGVTLPQAYTDAQVDAIDPEIRTIPDEV